MTLVSSNSQIVYMCLLSNNCMNNTSVVEIYLPVWLVISKGVIIQLFGFLLLFRLSVLIALPFQHIFINESPLKEGCQRYIVGQESLALGELLAFHTLPSRPRLTPHHFL
ncbi:hypothetical protein ATANTOWER_015824 [Ataeniobius toweri]|uniref:Uncharacterized protein n=1 Tax=Ataeniobius toweri TaxID=208326 RepID=A0ABU7AY33_9TELE|nr:hypothetical protein [Ataeniobius toweri]